MLTLLSQNLNCQIMMVRIDIPWALRVDCNSSQQVNKDVSEDMYQYVYDEEWDDKFYIGNLGSIDGDIAYEWYKGEYHRSSNEVFEEKLRDKIINDVTYLADRTKQSYNPSHTLDTITKTLSVSIPEIFIMKEDINVMEILAGASETISRSNMLYLMLIVNIGRRDYYHLTPDKLIRLILDMFHQFRLLKVYNERDEYYHYLFGKSV